MSERSMNQYRKELLYRKAAGERILSDYFEKLLSLFPAQDRSEIISLEETDAELDRFTVASTRLHQETGRISTSEPRAELSVMKRRQGEFFVLVDDDWKYCGMLLVRSMEDLNVGIEFGDKILNDIVFVSTDMSFATSFDYFEVAGSYLIDVKRWRER
ncbi:hypothetical protein WT72_10895 [Burkholderia pseudomultivorans]|uniref:hypothetical protein n=1 Tax=Burkholderia pseudomultivorans TaxID=1207504 RepID=UPI000759C7B5|nr:hypothetical protein [Burkholderia pseudomultivorans]KWI59476.1 hypothetical protein WT72_10895 [Burkholderia pseudomultivorans]